MILKLNLLKKFVEVGDWFQQAQDTFQFLAILNTAVSFCVY
jgi:hypothetical protein